METTKVIDLGDIAYENGLVLATTTTGTNGYPQNLKPAIIGFDSFEDAKELSREYDLRITTLFKKDGWDLWVRNSNTTYEPLTPSSTDFGDNFREYNPSDYDDLGDFYNQEGDYIRDEIKNISFDELKEHINRIEKLYSEIESLEENEILISDGTASYVFEKELTSYSYDTKNYVIALIQD